MAAPITSNRQWTPKEVQRFWEYHGRRTDLHPEYFSFQVGPGLAYFLRQTGRLHEGAEVLDYGCGPGFLLQHLLRQKARCHGTDASREAVEAVNRNFKEYSNWMGAAVTTHPPSPYSDASFDVVTCIETLEHLGDETLVGVIGEVRRLLKPGGVALFTTPNEEVLKHNYVLCPFCNTEYHKVQHVRSFSSDSLRDGLESQGLNVLFCRGVNLWEFQRGLPGWKDRSYRDVKDWLAKRWNSLIDRVSPRPFPSGRVFQSAAGEGGPHLCAVVERAAGWPSP